MRLGQLLTKWALIGVIDSTKTLYRTHEWSTDIIVIVKEIMLLKDETLGYVIFKETRKNNKCMYKLIHADITSSLFNTGMFVDNATLTKLDEHF